MSNGRRFRRATNPLGRRIGTQNAPRSRVTGRETRSVTVPNGATHELERYGGGAWMCSCPSYARLGWCLHAVDASSSSFVRPAP